MELTKPSMKFLLKFTMRFWGCIYWLSTLIGVNDINENSLQAYNVVLRGHLCLLTLIGVNGVDEELFSNLMWCPMCDTHYGDKILFKSSLQIYHEVQCVTLLEMIKFSLRVHFKPIVRSNADNHRVMETMKNFLKPTVRSNA